MNFAVSNSGGGKTKYLYIYWLHRLYNMQRDALWCTPLMAITPQIHIYIYIICIFIYILSVGILRQLDIPIGRLWRRRECGRAAMRAIDLRRWTGELRPCWWRHAVSENKKTQTVVQPRDIISCSLEVVVKAFLIHTTHARTWLQINE